jgi:predicted transposase YdaD
MYQDFRVIPVWEMEAQRVLEEGIIGLIPFTPLMKGSDDTVIREGVNLLRNRDVGEEAEVALALFASFVMDSQQVQKIVRWNMAVLRESPWYNQILQEGLHEGHLQGFQEGHEEGLQEGWRKGRQEGRQEGRQQGRQEGRQEGRREGKLDGQREAVVHLLQARFSPTGSHLADIADRLTLVKDEKHLQDLLVKAMYVSDLEAFREHLNGKSEA